MMKPNYAFICASMAFLLISLPSVWADDLPDLGDSSETVLSPLQEQRIADQIMQDVYSSNDVIEDPEINDYVQNLGYKLASNSPDPNQKFNFFVVKDTSINAFAMPGGVVGVHTGLIIAANSESEVAGVLGHEIGHVVQHHMARTLAKQKQDSVLNIATLALAILAARSNPQLGMGAMSAASAGSIQKRIDYTREHEREADRVGMQILAKAGFDTHAMGTFFETLQKGTRFSEGAAPTFLRTHPLTTERIADVRAREATGNFKLMPYNPDFDYVRAKLIAQLGSPQYAVDTFKSNLESRRYSSEAAQHYGLAQAYLRNLNPTLAQQELNWLTRNAEPHAMITNLAADIAMANKQTTQAAQLYKQGLVQYPSSRALIYGYVNLLLEQKQFDTAMRLISDKQAQFPQDPDLYDLASKGYALQGKQLLSHQALGEAYVRAYNLQKAIEQFDLASKAGDGDFYQQSMVESRLKQLKAMILDQKKAV